MAEWTPDVLGDEFEQLTLPLEDDTEGPVVATLVRALPPELTWWQQLRGDRRPLEDVDVLYVHGWSDYFFQKRLARFWTARGARFFALDLRKYGRSLRDGQTPGYTADLGVYDADLAAALAAMGRGESGAASGRRLVSTVPCTTSSCPDVTPERRPIGASGGGCRDGRSQGDQGGG